MFVLMVKYQYFRSVAKVMIIFELDKLFLH